MSLITVNPSYPTSLRVNRQEVVERAVRELGLGVYGTATGGSDASLIDTTRLRSARFSKHGFKEGYLRIGSTGDVRPVTSYEPLTGEVGVNPSLSAQVDAGERYQLFTYQHPTELLDHVDTILTQDIWIAQWALLTDVPDGDMEQPTATGDWAAVGATITKVSSQPMMSGRRHLKVVGSGADGYAKTKNPVAVEEGKGYHLSALARLESGDAATLVLYDLTHDEVIHEKSLTRYQTARPFIDATIPQGCRQVEIRLYSDGASGVTYWDDVCFYPLGAKTIRMPYWVHYPDQVQAWYRLRPEEHMVDIWSAEMVGMREYGWDVRPNQYGDGAAQAVSHRSSLNLPLYILAKRREEAFTSETDDYKHVSGNLVQALLSVKHFETLLRQPGAANADAAWVERQLARAGQDAKRELMRHASRLEMMLRAPDEPFFASS